MTTIEAGALIDLLRRRGVLITPTVRIAHSRDPDDDKFLDAPDYADRTLDLFFENFRRG